MAYPVGASDNRYMDFGTLTSNLSPFGRVAIAATPIFVSLMVRFVVGHHRAFGVILMGSVTWLAMNVVALAAG